jgi:wyosine [tRNA(Phe)-imidazoG37] synthetase (radical SAM superfamily)
MGESSVYGPVKSWRLGRSLGVDLLAVDSICSFNCIYCQLGKINQTTTERSIFVTTERMMEDLSVSNWESADAVTFSGSGEPTLAKNLGEAIEQVKAYTGKPVVVLTNSTMLGYRDVRLDLCEADKVLCKLDAWDDEMLRRINRPGPGIRLDAIVEGIVGLRRDFAGELAVQTMLLKDMDADDLRRYAALIDRIRPDEVQLNIPSRPVPAAFTIGNRENVSEPGPGAHVFKTVTRETLLGVRDRLEPMVPCEVLCK